MFTNIRKSDKGFTIVELLIVIVVIGLLAGLVLNTFQGAQARARDTERKTDIDALNTQLEAYHGLYQHYPSGSATDTTCLDGATSCALGVAIFPGFDVDALTEPGGDAINVVAATPTPAGGDYYYFPTGCVSGACTSYTLYANLEEEADYVENSLN